MSSAVDVTALAINVTIPESLRWTDTRRGEEFQLSTRNVRLRPDGHLAAERVGDPAIQLLGALGCRTGQRRLRLTSSGPAWSR